MAAGAPRTCRMADVMKLIGAQLATAQYSASAMKVVTDANAGLAGATMPWIRLVKIDLDGRAEQRNEYVDPPKGSVCNGTVYITVVCPDAATATNIGALETAMDGVMDVMEFAELNSDTTRHRVRVSTWRMSVDPNPDETNRLRTGGIELDLVVTRDKA